MGTKTIKLSSEAIKAIEEALSGGKSCEVKLRKTDIIVLQNDRKIISSTALSSS